LEANKQHLTKATT